MPIGIINEKPIRRTQSIQQFKDKIIGAWAGQMIGITMASYVDYKFQGSFVPQYFQWKWDSTTLLRRFEENPGLYDDLFLDASLLQIFDMQGIDASQKLLGSAYAESAFYLQHASQASRYNILHGISPPESGHWLNNPHADDTDFFSVADLVGMITPGMPAVTQAVSDKIGHIMSYGDGYYGGVYVASLYSHAFIETKTSRIVEEALKNIPSRSAVSMAVHDVIKWHQQFPTDWRSTWFEIQKKWSEDFGCPEGAYQPFNKDAKLSASYITMALLYGNGDFENSMDIALRTSQHCDSNAASVAGIIGVLQGYEKLPVLWRNSFENIKEKIIPFHNITIIEAADKIYSLATTFIKANDGKVKDNEIVITYAKPNDLKYEESFQGHYPKEKISLKNQKLTDSLELEFEGIGFVVTGDALSINTIEDYTFETELYLNGKFLEKIDLPTNYLTRRSDLFWQYQLPHQKHKLTIKLLNPNNDHQVLLSDLLVYDVRNR